MVQGFVALADLWHKYSLILSPRNSVKIKFNIFINAKIPVNIQIV